MPNLAARASPHTVHACAELDALLESAWKQQLRHSPTARRIEEGRYDARLYAIYLVETFHYTKHNARNQALVGVRADSGPDDLRYCRLRLRGAGLHSYSRARNSRRAHR